jgi:hypothetical protein
MPFTSTLTMPSLDPASTWRAAARESTASRAILGRLRRSWFGVAVFAVGLLALARAQQFYGSLLRGWDAQFYYAEARSIVFDRDLDLTGDLQQTLDPVPFDADHDGTFEKVRRTATGRIRSSYPIGLSLLEIPGLVLGHGLRRALCGVGICSTQLAGFAAVEIWSVALWLLAVFAVGAQVLDELLRRYVRSPWREGSVLAAWFGTSLFYYSSIFPFMTHAAGFSFVVFTIFIAERIRSGETGLGRFLFLGLLLGMLFMLRTQQLTILLPVALMLGPFLHRRPPGWVGALAVCGGTLLALVAVQGWFYSHTAGEWALKGYMRGGFSWSEPALGMALLNPARGLLWISPIVLLAGLGFATTAPRNVPASFAAFALQGVMQVYVIASWSTPHQGDAFGLRMWSECAAAVACGLSLLYMRAAPLRKLVVTTAAVGCVAWTTRLLVVYVTGGLSVGISYGECARQALGW